MSRPLRHVIDRARRELGSRVAIPVRLPWGALMLAWPDVMGRHLRQGGFEENERRFVERFLKPGMVVLDAGAHHGFYTLLAARRVGSRGRVVAFEPSARERRRLRINLVLNVSRNVRVEPLALGAHNGRGAFFVVSGIDDGCNSMRPPVVDDPYTRTTVRVVTLDAYLAEHRIGPVDFVKIDVEGGELALLRGAERLLASPSRPVLMCELVDTRTAPWNYQARDIHAFLARRDYLWFSPTPSGHLRPVSAKDRYHENLVAVPAEGVSTIADLVASDDPREAHSSARCEAAPAAENPPGLVARAEGHVEAIKEAEEPVRASS
jgi:FkbM family methyltransferase